MSINVTVTGNPVNIKRGQMITNPHKDKKEFDKRRLLRLEQVRQQSKDLAENVRNKVRNEKKKQLKDIERDGKEKLKNWQNRKLLELQNQYLDALDEIGVGHKAAEQLADESEILESQRQRNDETAKARGKLAQTKHQVQRNEDNYKKAVPIQHKKLVRDIENTRAALVSAMPKNQTKRTQAKVKKNATTTDINISIPNESDSTQDSSSDSSSKQETKCRKSCTEDSHGESESACECSDSQSTDVKRKEPDHQFFSKEKAAVRPKSYQETLDDRRHLIDDFRSNSKTIPIDTRISDRIRQRKFMSTQPDYCDSPAAEIRPSSRSVKDHLELSSDDCICTKVHSCCTCKSSRSAAVQTDGKMICKCDCAKSSTCKTQLRSEGMSSQKIDGQLPKEIPPEEIPSKPAVKLKATQEMPGTTSTLSTSFKRVPHYDFPNRFVTEKQSGTQVEKIDEASLEVVPNITSEVEWQDRIKQRDIDAQIRGKRAMEKEKTQRDYQELMKKLPILQRKEHIAQIGSDKPEYHMSEERLKERERERQNRLENAYSQAIPTLKPKLVTLTKRKMEIDKTDEPFQILNGDDSRTLNLGKWDTDTVPKTMFSAEEVHEIIKAFTVQRPEDRKAKLKQLLKSLKLQKEQLINEIRALPRDDSIDALIVDLTSFSDDEKTHRSGQHKSNDKARKRRLEDSDTSDTSSDVKARERRSKSKTSRKDKHGRSPNKKMKKPSRVLILQNMSTQTTPKSTKEKSSTTTTTETLPSNEQIDLPKSVNICTKSHIPCDCYKGKDGESTEEVCKILIKIDEENSPKIEVVQNARDEPDRKPVQRGNKDSSPKKSTKNIPSSGKENKSPTHPQRSIATNTTATQINFPASKDSKKSLRNKKETWKDQLSKNSMSTSSTSYMSPPDFSKPNTTASTETSKQSMYNLRKKPQQTDIVFGVSDSKVSSQSTNEQDQKIKNQLLSYIIKLLSMSKASLDDLGISSSDVQTPSQSIIEMEPNNPVAALHNALRRLNFKSVDFEKDLSQLVDGQSVPQNSTIESSEWSGSREHPIPCQKQKSSSGGKPTKESLLSQYADVTDSCTKRIANLAAMIEQLREEKLQMMESPPLMPKYVQDSRLSPQLDNVQQLTPTFSDKDNSTKYFEFPPYEKSKASSNSTVSLDEEELNRRLLEIDMSLAEKLKKFSHERDGPVASTQVEAIDHLQHHPAVLVSEGHVDHSDQQFLNRLHRLIQESHERDDELEMVKPTSDVASKSHSFTPFLVDIPKLPILEPEPEMPNGGSEKRHPPPSKGLISAKKFNGNISLVPHELSTIAEADSQISTKISPNQSKMNTTIDRELRQLLVQALSPTNEEPPSSVNQPKSIEESDPTSEARSQKIKSTVDNQAIFSDGNKSLTCSDSTCTNLVLSSSLSKLSSSSSSSDLKSIEAMLRSIGMEWAIPTLHKTQEALALTSSTSSVDLSSKNNIGKSTSDSEVSLKEFLKKQLKTKFSSSSLNKSDASPASFVRECSEISAIHDKTKQRTSTPVLSSKSTNKSKEEQLFSGASDISSVRNSSANFSGKQSFHSLLGDKEQSSTTKSSVK